MPKKIPILLVILTIFFILLISLTVHSSKLIQADNLLLDGQLSHKNQLPILIIFSQHGCPYCDIAIDEALEPISRLLEYASKVIVREIIDDAVFTDFHNKVTSAAMFGAQYGIDFYPTVIILNQHGQQIAPKLIGIVDKDFYWAKIDKLIKIAHENLPAK